MAKKGVIFPQESRADVAWAPRRCDMACKVTWQRHADPCERLHGTELARTRGRATRVHADARVAPHGMSVRLASDGPTSIVGPSKIVGAVTQMR